MEHFGRRWPLIVGGVWQAIWLFVFASVGTAKDPSSDKTAGSRK
jgi:MFS transporter, SP family, sugar:H+ symporter